MNNRKRDAIKGRVSKPTPKKKQPKSSSPRKPRKDDNKALVTINVHGQGELLEYLIKQLPSYSRTKIKGYLSRKQISVNGVPITQFDYPLANKDTIIIHEKTLRINKEDSRRLNIIYEDDDFIVINKPAGLLSVASDNDKHETAYRYVSDYVKQTHPRARIYVVQRLDKETSGVLAFVKSVKMRNALTKDWNTLVKERAYAAVTVGTPKKLEDTLEDYLFTNSTNLMFVGNKSPESVLAITKYKVTAHNDKFALLDVRIETGKKNQIRVQLKNIGTPIIGDEKYETHADPLKRLGLHAYSLVLTNPITEQTLHFSAPTPDSFFQLVK